MKLKNRYSGEVLELMGELSPVERSMWRLRKAVLDFDRFIDANNYYCSFLTITLTDENVKKGHRWISGFMDLVRHTLESAGVDVKYIAVLEIQEKRYSRYGVLAPHWHVVIGCSKFGALPDSMKNKKTGHVIRVRDGEVITFDWLHKNIKQKLGRYFVCDAYSNHIYGYLSKYISKGSDLEEYKRRAVEAGKRVRIFSASRIPIQYRMTDGQALEYAALLLSHPEFSDLYWRREDSRIVARAKSVQERFIGSSLLSSKVTYPKVHVIPGDWVVTDELSFEAKGGDENV